MFFLGVAILFFPSQKVKAANYTCGISASCPGGGAPLCVYPNTCTNWQFCDNGIGCSQYDCYPPYQPCGSCSPCTTPPPATTTCYRCNAGGWCESYTGSTPCGTDCNSCGGGGGGGSCTATAPSQATLTSPTPGETNVLSPVTLRWTDGTSWGVGCPQNNHYQVFLKEVPEGSSCAVAGYSQIANTGALSYTVNVNYNSAYCWFIRKSNGSLFAQTPTRQFVTVKRSVVQNVSIVNAGECFGNNISGRADEANTSNPIELF